MRRLAFLPFLLLLLACDELMPSTGGSGGGGAAGASSASGASTAAAAAVPCRGFKDIAGLCLDTSCLETSACDQQAPIPCEPGAFGPGTCFAGRCAYVNDGRGCGSGADCPCGLCGADGRCYEDRFGSCGYCSGASNPSSSGNLACRSCLDTCKGSGPLCCAGPGCLCESQCEGFL